MPLPVNPGQLRTELALEALTPASDGHGGFNEVWSEVARVWGLVEPVRAKDPFGADRRMPATEHRVTVRFRGDVRSGMRFGWGGRRLLIRTVRDLDETGRFLLCRTEEDGR